jgi:single-strand DNA-binding protein
MKNGVNKVTIVGNVGDDPRIHSTNGNVQVAKLSVATNESYKDREGKEVNKTEWHRIVAWDKRAELMKDFVKKGDPIYIEGRLRTSSWEDKEGNKKYSTEIFCDNLVFLTTQK